MIRPASMLELKQPTKRGFTLIEIMVAMALGMILIAGAFEMHAAFSRQIIRQNETTDMQQSLRVAREMIARSLRSAGAGLSGGTIQYYDCGTGMSKVWYPVQFSNSNLYADPMPTDANPGDTEAGDPDWLRTVTLEPDSRVSLVSLPNGDLNVSDASQWKPGDLVFVYNGNSTIDLTKHVVYARQVTAVTLIGGGPGGTLKYCYAGGELADTGMQQIVAPVPVYRIDRFTTYRIDTSDQKTPRLRASYTRPGAAPAWQTLTENIEDMQIALILADGTVCGRNGNSVDAPAACNPQNARAVRFTLVARSSSPIPGFGLGIPGGYEDEVPGPADSYLRRPVTSEIELRNFLP